MIFNFLKSKPTLKELIPHGFVDIHSHILPGIDDGAKNIEESMELISKMKKMGICKIIGTPHTIPGVYNNDNNTIQRSFELLKKNINIDIELDYASEYMIDYSLINKAKQKLLLPIKGNYVLIEMSYLSPPQNLYEILYEIKVNNYTPILAHPERYIYLHKNFNEYYKLKKIGCYFQINLLSCVGYYGKNVTKITDNLLKLKMVDFVGSDIHNLGHLKMFSKRLSIKNIDFLKIAINKTKNLF